jgi:RimJ/RimL family protein N-acetyltransferase
MLIGSKVCLGPFFQSDANVIFNWRNSVEVMHLDGLYRPVSQAGFDEWFGGIGKDASRVVFSIRKYGNLDFLGYVQIIHIHPIFRTAEIGIMIGDIANRGRGYGQEALRLCIDFCWKELNLQRLTVMVIGHNEVALHTYQKLGFEPEGVIRRAIYRDGGFSDVTLLGLLRA